MADGCDGRPGITLSEKDKNGRRKREHNRARLFQLRSQLSILASVPSKSHGTQGTRRDSMVTRVSPPPGGDKVITEALDHQCRSICRAW